MWRWLGIRQFWISSVKGAHFGVRGGAHLWATFSKGHFWIRFARWRWLGIRPFCDKFSKGSAIRRSLRRAHMGNVFRKGMFWIRFARWCLLAIRPFGLLAIRPFWISRHDRGYIASCRSWDATGFAGIQHKRDSIQNIERLCCLMFIISVIITIIIFDYYYY